MRAHVFCAVAGLFGIAVVAACGFSTSGLQETGKGGGSTSTTSTTSSSGSVTTSTTGTGGASTSSSSSTSSTSSSTTSSSGGDLCTNGKKDPGEVATDCGGACPGCPNGTACTGDVDCESGYCVEGLCCDSACTDGCMSCQGSATGGKDGTCANVVAGKDPKSVCTPGKCDGNDACACTNGVKDGNETDVDCGGDCGGCDLVQACKADGDCASGHCVTEWDGAKICCDTTCSGTCKSCNLGGDYSGTCLPRAAGDDTPCTSGKACNLTGSCVTGGATGASCTGNGNCVSGHCFNGTCRAYSNSGGPCTSDYGCPGGPGVCDNGICQ